MIPVAGHVGHARPALGTVALCGQWNPVPAFASG
jgi:hypothetical protein